VEDILDKNGAPQGQFSFFKLTEYGCPLLKFSLISLTGA